MCEAITIDVIGSCQYRHFVLRVILIMKRIVNGQTPTGIVKDSKPVLMNNFARAETAQYYAVA